MSRAREKQGNVASPGAIAVPTLVFRLPCALNTQVLQENSMENFFLSLNWHRYLVNQNETH